MFGCANWTRYRIKSASLGLPRYWLTVASSAEDFPHPVAASSSIGPHFRIAHADRYVSGRVGRERSILAPLITQGFQARDSSALGRSARSAAPQNHGRSRNQFCSRSPPRTSGLSSSKPALSKPASNNRRMVPISGPVSFTSFGAYGENLPPVRGETHGMKATARILLTLVSESE